MPTPKVFGGIRRVDAKSDKSIRVKPCDIRRAVCRDHQKCVVARAILRQLGSTAKWVDVGQSVVLVGISSKRAERYYLPSLAREQVRFFDENEGRAAPCEVHLMSALVHRGKYNGKSKVRPLGSRPHEAIEKRKKRKRGKNILKPSR